MPNVLITGVSDGIGYALANLFLEKGWQVYVLSRTCPATLRASSNFYFKPCDLADTDDSTDWFDGELNSIASHGVDFAYLNAGISGGAPVASKDVTGADLDRTLRVNTLANKYILDALLRLEKRPEVVCFSASIAGVRYRAGMLAYSMSKAALLALCGVYAQEYPDVFFAPIGMCNVDTKLSESIVNNPSINHFPEHMKLKERFKLPGYLVSASQRAEDVFSIIHGDREKWLKSGEFIEIRSISMT